MFFFSLVFWLLFFLFLFVSALWSIKIISIISERKRTVKVPKFSDARKHSCNLPKIQTKRPNFRVFRQKDANGIANSEGPDQTAPLRSALFAQTNLSENLGSLL